MKVPLINPSSTYELIEEVLLVEGSVNSKSSVNTFKFSHMCYNNGPLFIVKPFGYVPNLEAICMFFSPSKARVTTSYIKGLLSQCKIRA